jgi:acyl transferase domain-containing protein/acyl carrier protein
MPENTSPTDHDNHIAIIGVACRMPGARNAMEFWQNLLNGVESLTRFSEDELREAGVDPQLIGSPNYVPARGIIGGADQFDAAFFGIPPREAELLDPQQRIFLECAWHALEDAGYDPDKTDARIGVFGGVGSNWHLGDASRHPEVIKFASGASVVTGNDKDYVTTRVSYKLNLTGPSVNVQSACSTSLVATILGCNGLRDYQCDLVLAGGATIEIPEKKGYFYQEGGMESPDGRCRPFDAKANGTVFSRGAGVVVLKRLGDAVRDRDHIYAVIRGGAVNNDGGHKIGFTAPSVKGQVEVAIAALETAGVRADSIAFVEAHGTATTLGDPIEVASLTQAFRAYTNQMQFCALGSVKGNIGHTDVASGIAGLIKVALALKTHELPASINYETANPKIAFPESPFYVNTERRSLTRNGAPLRALINSFGVGGTNACLILEEPPPAVPPPEEEPPHLVVLSSKTSTALDAFCAEFADHLEKVPPVSLSDLAYTSQVARKHFACRRWAVVRDRANLIAQLRQGTGLAICDEKARQLVFAFPGQGNQYVGMGRGLYRRYAAYKAVVDECSEILLPWVGLDLREILYAEGDGGGGAAAKLDETYVTQPALFVASYAQAKLWLSFGLQPDALVGHSVGEYVAACLAGVFSLEDALKAVAERGRIIQQLPGGSMLAILATEEAVIPLLPVGVEVAAANSPRLTVVAGPTIAIEMLEGKLKTAKLPAKRLGTSHAFHSAMMEAALPEVATLFATIALQPPNIPIVSTVTGKWLTPSEAVDANYWVRHVRQAVRFADATRTLLRDTVPAVFLESGPGHSLESAIKSQLNDDSASVVIGSQRAAMETGEDADYLMNAVARVWAAGRPIAWERLHANHPRRRVPLPGYSFERQRFSLDFWKLAAAPTKPECALRNPDVGDWFYVPTWKRTSSAVLRQSLGRHEDQDEKGKCWLLFADPTCLAERLAERICADGGEAILVRMGERFAQQSEKEFTVAPESSADYNELLQTLKASGRRPSQAIHFWNFQQSLTSGTGAQIEREEGLAFYSPLFAAQAFINQNLLDGLKFLVLAHGACSVLGEPVTRPAAAMATGPCRVFGKEFPMVKARFLDLQPTEDPAETQRMADDLFHEAQLDSEETVAAYRNGHRWTESYERVSLEQPANGLRDRLKPNGTYLITGGVGGLGLLLAKEIARTVPARLILNFRSPLPERTEWVRWVTEHPTDDPTSGKVRAIQEIEELGATVMLACADVTNLAAMGEVVAEARARFGTIDGAIHAAGMAGGGIIALKSEEMAAEVLAPKVRGTLVLDAVLRELPLDFFLIFSSITSVLGEAGRVDYCSANSFQDAFVALRNQEQPGRMVTMNWGAWTEVGMAARWQDEKAKKIGGRRSVPRRGHAPLLQLIQKGVGEEVYDVVLNPESDWVITEHLIFGVPTLVGACFIELAYRLGKILDPKEMPELENLYFLAPLMFPPNEPKRLRLFVRQDKEAYRFSFKSLPVAMDEHEGDWQQHFVGELRLRGAAAKSDSAPTQLPTLNDLRARLIGRPVAWKTKIVVDGEPVMEFGPRWDLLQRLSAGDREWLAELELPSVFASDLQEFAFHPALTDVAIAAAIGSVTNEPYLPLGYRRFQLRAGYTTRNLLSHIRLKGDFHDGDETLAFDVTIFDPEGNELAKVERYTLKRVAALKQSARQASATPAAAAAPVNIANPDDISPEEGLDALRRIMAAPLLTQVVVSPRSVEELIEEEIVTRRKLLVKNSAESAEIRPAPAHPRPALQTPYCAPENEVEKAIAEVWEGILGIQGIGVDDSFTELGGNSLLAVQTVANIAEAFQVDLSVEAFYKEPTIRKVAETVLELVISLTSNDMLEQVIAEINE